MGFTEDYPVGIQSYIQFYPERAEHFAQSSRSSLTPWKKGGLSSLPTQGKPLFLSPGLSSPHTADTHR